MAPKPSFYKKHRTLFNPNRIYNGQDILKNHFLHSHPIVYTDNVTDFTQVEEYADKASHVWLVDKEIESLRTFPWWFKIPKSSEATVFQFPCVYKNSWKIYNWNSVQLVPTKTAKEYTKSRQRQVAGEYDILQGKRTFDKFYIGDELPVEYLRSDIKCVPNIKEAQRQSETALCWIIPKDVDIRTSFKFDYLPDYWALHYCHVFRNQDHYDGILLMPKYYKVAKNEEDYWFFASKKEVDIDASTPKPYDIFYIDSYDEYLEAAATSTSRMFWVVWDDVEVRNDFDFDYHIPKQDTNQTNATHVFKNGDCYDGICLFSVENLVTKNEFEHRHFIRRINVDIVASDPKLVNV